MSPVPIAAWRVMVIGILAFLLLLGQLYIVLPVVDLVADIPGAGPGAAPSSLTAFALPYAAGFLLLGPLADRVDPRTVMIASLTIALIATLAAGFAPDWGWFLIARGLQGLGAAPFTPAILLVISTRVVQARRLVATSAVICAGMGAAIVAQVVAQLAGPTLGLRGLFLAFAIAIGACLGALVVLLPGAVSRPRAPRAGGRASLAGAYLALATLLTRRRIVLLLITAVSYLTVFVGLYAAIQLAGPPSIAEDPAMMLIVRASAAPAMIAIPLVVPFLARRSGRARIVSALTIGITATALLALLALTGTLSVPVFAVCMLVVAAAIAVAAPATVTEVMGAAPEAPAAANALYSAAIFGGASLGAPLAASVIALAGDVSGFGAFAMVCAAGLAGALALAAGALRRVTDPAGRGALTPRKK